jgi:hypothetical protein
MIYTYDFLRSTLYKYEYCGIYIDYDIFWFVLNYDGDEISDYFVDIQPIVENIWIYIYMYLYILT